MFPYSPLQVCEPIPIFYVIFSWPQALSLYWFASGFGMLAGAIAIKAVLFWPR